MEELPVVVVILSGIGAVTVIWFIVRGIGAVLPWARRDDARSNPDALPTDTLSDSWRKTDTKRHEKREPDAIRDSRGRDRSDSDTYSREVNLDDSIESFSALLGEFWGVATGNPSSEIVQDNLQAQKAALRQRMPAEENGTERIHQTHPLTIGRRTDGDTVQIYWEWGEGLNYRLVGFRTTDGHHHDPYNPGKNGSQIIDTAERAGYTIDRPDGNGPFYYTLYLISGSQYGSTNQAHVQRSNTTLGKLLDLAEEHGAQISQRGLVRFSVDLSENQQSQQSEGGEGQLRAEFQETVNNFSLKTRALNELRKRRDEEIEKVEEMYENGEISREEMEELMQMIEDEYDSARLRIKEDF